jgi:hypothetical protein
MFIRYFAVVSLPAERAEEALLRRPSEWLPGLALDADEHGERLLVEVGFGSEGGRVGKLVEVDVGEAVHLGTKVALPMSWRATGPQGLFPVLDGDLELAPLGQDRTQVAVSAQYRPPLGAIGRIMDRAMLHRVAEATVKDFVDRVARVIVERAAEAPEPN